jgi:hypothetical protein
MLSFVRIIQQHVAESSVNSKLEKVWKKVVNIITSGTLTHPKENHKKSQLRWQSLDQHMSLGTSENSAGVLTTQLESVVHGDISIKSLAAKQNSDMHVLCCSCNSDFPQTYSVY